MGHGDKDEERYTVVEIRLPISGVIKDSPYLFKGKVATSTLSVRVKLNGYSDSAEQAVDDAVDKLSDALNKLLSGD